MRFVLEETSWGWDGRDRDAYVERIELLLDRIDTAIEREEGWAASRYFWEQTAFGLMSISDLVWGEDSPLGLHRNVRERLTALFGQMLFWDEREEWPALEATVGGEAVEFSSVVVAHKRVFGRRAVACLPLPGRWRGPQQVVVDNAVCVVHFVVDEASHRAFFRDALDVERVDESNIAIHTAHAFPDLFFLQDVWDGVRHFEGGFARVRDELMRFLAILDGHGAWVFTDKTGRLSREESEPQHGEAKPITNDLVMARLKKWGLVMSPEKPNVRADGVRRRAREKMLDGETLYCEWHYKFDPHINRVHIHPPVSASGGKVVVAIFRDHLP